MPLERALNAAFANTSQESSEFAAWLLARTRPTVAPARVVMARGNNPWSKSLVDGVESETDILVVFEPERGGLRFALHIENKRPGDRFRAGQAKRYAVRAAEWVGLEAWGSYRAFATVLLASENFLSKHLDEKAIFDFTLRYEDVARFIPQFDM